MWLSIVSRKRSAAVPGCNLPDETGLDPGPQSGGQKMNVVLPGFIGALFGIFTFLIELRIWCLWQWVKLARAGGSK
jgi:hypothetical protein